MDKLTPKKLNHDELVSQAYEMRIESRSFSEIAARLGVCKASAFNYVQEAKQKYEKFQEVNLNHLRLMRVQQVEKLIRSRLDDLAACVLPKALSQGYDEEGEPLSEMDLIGIEKSFIRDRSYIIIDLMRLYQELSRLQGLYEYDKVDGFIDKKEATLNVEVANLSDGELLSLFNDIQRGK